MGKIKDFIYNFLVRKNKNVQYEYERYVMEHIIEHYEKRSSHWKILLKLNWHYRIKKNNEPMLYWDVYNLDSNKNKECIGIAVKELDVASVDTEETSLVCDNVSEKNVCGEEQKELDVASVDTEGASLVCGNVSEKNVCGEKQKELDVASDGTEETSLVYDNVSEKNIYSGEKIKLNIASVDDTVISLKWNKVTGIKRYYVQKCLYKNNEYRNDGVTERITFNVRKLNPDTKYKFRIIGVTFSEEEVVSNEVNVATLCSINKSEPNPYMDGAESEICGRRTVHFLAKELVKYDIISFDIFDTLVFRPFSKPRDLFMMLDAQFEMLGFASIRQNAEMTVRSIAEKLKGNREVTIEDIYKEIEKRTGIPKEEGIKTEVELEYDMCYANPYMLRLFNLLKCMGKKIILVSDMYLTSDIISRILEKCGYVGYEELFISCEHNSNKYTGTLYKNVKSKLGNELKYIHIGDNYKADVECAKANGMDTFYYKGVNDIGNQYRATQYGMQELIGSAYGGIINSFLHNGLNKANVYYEYGFIYGGIYIYGFCEWIHKYAKKNGLDKVLFFARDGYVYKKVYDMLFDDIPSEYVFSSRIANSYMCAEKQRDNFLVRNIETKARYGLKTTINNFFDIFNLHFLDDELKKYNLRLYHEIAQWNVKILVQFVIDYWDEIIESMEKNNKKYEEYITAMLQGCQNVAVVDTGWQGTTLMGMKWLIESKWKMGCKVHCLMAASQTVNPIVNQAQLMSEDIVVYMFSSSFNRDLYLFHKKAYKGNLTSYLFEIFTQAPHPTFSTISQKNDEFNFEFGIPEVENYWMINEIQKGIVDFCMMYNKMFKKYPGMHNISGHDAYIPFKFIAKNPRMFKQFFLDFSYSKTTGGDVKNYSMETIGELFEEQKK